MPAVLPADPFVELAAPGGIPVHLCRTGAFKAVHVLWAYELPLDGGTAARALLPDLLTHATRRLPGLAAIAARCEELYGAELLASAAAFGDRQLLRFGFEVVGDRWAGQPLFDGAVDLLAEVLHDPLLEGGRFRQDHFEQERANLVRAIEGLEDDKQLLAYRRLVEALHAGTPFARHAWGRLEEARALDAGQALQAWREVVERAPVRAFVVGDVDEACVLRAVERLAGGAHPPPGPPVRPPPLPARPPRELREEQPVAQGKLAMGWRLPAELLPGSAAPLLGMVLGGDTFSRLFLRVREAEGLAYGCSAAVSVETGTLVVQAGIDPERAPRVRELVLEELQALGRDGPTEAELSLARRALLRRLADLRDSPRALCAVRHAALLAGRPHELAAAEASVRRATAAEVRDLAAAARLDTTFLLAPEAG